MGLNSVFPVVFDDIYPKGAFLGGGGVTPVKDWKRSTADEFVQAEEQVLDPASGEVVRLPVWSVTILDGDWEQRADPITVRIVARHQPVVPEPVEGMPFRPVVLEGMAIEARVNRDKCQAPWGGRQHRCGGRVDWNVWARGLRPAGTPARSGNGKASVS